MFEKYEKPEYILFSSSQKASKNLCDKKINISYNFY